MSKSFVLPTTERRRLSREDAGLSIRETEGSAPRFVGYASKFNERTEIGNPFTWGFYEEVASGAFSKTLKEGDARFLVDHLTNLVVSRVSAGTLDLAQDQIGLGVDSALNDRKSYVADLIENLRDLSITGMSFGFQVVKDAWSMVDVETKDGKVLEAELRIIQEVKLWEVSAVTFPAYESTEAGLRSVATALIRSGDLDRLARHAEREPDLMRYVPEPAEATRATKEEPAASTPDLDVKELMKVKRFIAEKVATTDLRRGR